MIHQQKSSVQFYVSYLQDGLLCMCDLSIKINIKKRCFIFIMVVLETILGII